jgi:hypothetical protein
MEESRKVPSLPKPAFVASKTRSKPNSFISKTLHKN